MRRLLAAIWLAVKHVWYNRRLEAGLLLGVTAAVGVASAVPIYTSGSLQRGLMREWTASAASRPPYALLASVWRTGPNQEPATLEQYNALDAMLAEEVPARLGMQPLSRSRHAGLGARLVRPVGEGEQLSRNPYGEILFLSNLKELIRIVDGRWPAEEPRPDGVVEVIVDVETIDALGVLVGRQYVYSAEVPATLTEAARQEPIRFEVVGAFTVDSADIRDWLMPPPFDNSLFVTERLFFEHLMGELGLAPSTMDWYWVFDHGDVRVHELGRHIQALRAVEARAGQIMSGFRYWVSPINLFQRYEARAEEISRFLSALSLPVLGIVFYFIALTAGLAVANRGNEIATLRSRGAGAIQIVLGFLIEWVILALIALAVGPYIGLWIARILGAAAGFLSFVNRVALPAELHAEAYQYGAAAAAVAVAAAMIPTIPYTRYTIVTFKHRLARKPRALPWNRFFPDFFLLAAAWWGYRQLGRGAMAEGGLPIDPSLYLVPFLFVLGGGLLFLRLFPWLMTLIDWLTARRAGVSWVLTVRQLARNPVHYAPLLLLMTVTVASGVYASSAARTLEINHADRIHYAFGADVILEEQWRRPAFAPPPGAGRETESAEPVPTGSEVYEPPFYVHQELPGVAAAARVLTRDVGLRVGGTFRQNGRMMALDAHEFVQVAWDRSGLLPHHRNAYLNLLIMYPEAALVSRGFLEANGLNPGDWMSVQLQQLEIELLVAAPIDYWPTLYPTDGPFVVANIDYIQEYAPLEPYRVWLRMEPGGNLQDVVDGLAEKGVYVTRVLDGRAALVEGRRDPFRMGFFGILSISFLVAVVTTVGGFFLFHFLSMRNRALQFGVLRAMGLSVGQVVASLSLEGLLSVGLGLAAGTVLGRLASQVFLPFLEVGSEAADRIPPFLVVVEAADITRIYAILLAMLVVGVGALAVALMRIRLYEAVKLGEEA